MNDSGERMTPPVPRRIEPRTLEELVERAVSLAGNENALAHDVHAAAYVVSRSAELGRWALRRLPRARRLRLRAVIDILSITPLGAAPPRHDPLPRPFAEIACDVALASLLGDVSPRHRAIATSIAFSLWTACRPTPSRCHAVRAAAERALHDPLTHRLVDLLRRSATVPAAYGALVELAARLVDAPDPEGWSAMSALRGLRVAPRRTLPIRWFLAVADQERSREPTVTRVRCVCELLSGLVGEDGREPFAVAEWRRANASFLAVAQERPSPEWPVQVVSL